MANRTEASTIWITALLYTFGTTIIGWFAVPLFGFLIALIGYWLVRRAQTMMYNTGNYLDMGDPMQFMYNPSFVFRWSCRFMRLWWGLLIFIHGVLILVGGRMAMLDLPY